jgi:serine/threonine-protein kinase RsbW
MRRIPPERIVIAIPNRLDLLGILNHAITEIGEYLELDSDDVDALAIAVIEAGTNAVQHGSPAEGVSTVEFRFEITEGAVAVQVRDFGPGFDLGAVDRQDTGEGVLQSRGRGIFLMRAFMDRVDFIFGRNGGTTVQLFKRFKPLSDPKD